ncbi:putative membrane protein SirB2 [Volucribacter psittacicida]|uniref:Putative membrane protein SirB2 n=1 Tax=Volucribacter psittacicida TaxID=203482 RepID=A0A4R1FW10_9PAST|nr:SirB2 family protein [Volucribacter psittacicida]TCJ98360.1 putative membrane protein SirB2 [Volucribacter psittacicida]
MFNSLTLLYIHIISAYSSLLLFIMRSAMQFHGKNWRSIKLLKILPHLTDTLLLASGLAIIILLGYGLPTWLIIKLLLLVGYIIFAAKTLSKKSLGLNPIHFSIACACFIGAMIVAYLH